MTDSIDKGERDCGATPALIDTIMINLDVLTHADRDDVPTILKALVGNFLTAVGCARLVEEYDATMNMVGGSPYLKLTFDAERMLDTPHIKVATVIQLPHVEICNSPRASLLRSADFMHDNGWLPNSNWPAMCTGIHESSDSRSSDDGIVVADLNYDAYQIMLGWGEIMSVHALNRTYDVANEVNSEPLDKPLPEWGEPPTGTTHFENVNGVPKWYKYDCELSQKDSERFYQKDPGWFSYTGMNWVSIVDKPEGMTPYPHDPRHKKEESPSQPFQVLKTLQGVDLNEVFAGGLPRIAFDLTEIVPGSRTSIAESLRNAMVSFLREPPRKYLRSLNLGDLDLGNDQNEILILEMDHVPYLSLRALVHDPKDLVTLSIASTLFRGERIPGDGTDYGTTGVSFQTLVQEFVNHGDTIPNNSQSEIPQGGNGDYSSEQLLKFQLDELEARVMQLEGEFERGIFGPNHNEPKWSSGPEYQQEVQPEKDRYYLVSIDGTIPIPSHINALTKHEVWLSPGHILSKERCRFYHMPSGKIARA